ncbi:MAG TPA: GvpL/GvpF family gas vesicle protein [Actinomadura sp.]|nr:GvpL/GvpF family gas vesicle protein [Actinomadura sp.]
MTEAGIYVYAVSRGLPHHPPARARGVGGAPVRVLEECGLAAVVSTVSLAEFGEEALRHNLEDLGWLESTARAHHAVIDDAAASAVILPLRLVTIYRDDQRVRDVLRERNEEFARALDRITGRTEWGVKGYADPQELMRSDATAGDTAGGRPGTSYLLRRRAERHSEEEARSEATDCAERIDTALRDLAAARCLHPPQDPQLSGHQGWMILNAAYLVDDTRAEDFRAAVASLADLRPGIRLQLTGPWAPYSFATEEESWTGS